MTIKQWKTQKRRGGNRIIDAYKYILSSFAYSDAKHDFSNVSGYRGNFYLNYKHTIQNDIPISPHTEYTEEMLLKSINITHVNNYPNTTNFTIDNIIYNTEPVYHIDFLLNDIIKRKYIVNIELYQTKTEIRANVSDFVHLFGGMRTFIMDSANMKFLDGFKNNSTTEFYNTNEPYYILYNREMENDPARKAELETKHYDAKGYCLEKVTDIDPADIIYRKWNREPMLYSNMYYSNKNFSLNRNNTTCVLTIYDDNHTERYEIQKDSNTPNELINDMNNRGLSPSMVFQRKRAGDCLQALSVFDNSRQLTNNNAHNAPKMLITTDRMLLYYSLVMGIDVGFTVIRDAGIHTKHYLLVFLNKDDKYVHNFPPYNYGRNGNNPVRRGGKTNTRKIQRSAIKKLKHNISKRNSRLRMSNTRILDELYSQAIPSEIIQYAYPLYDIMPLDSEQTKKDALISMKHFILSSINRQKLVAYVSFLNHKTFDMHYVATILNMLYNGENVNGLQTELYDESYHNELYIRCTPYLRSIYKIPKIDHKIKEVIDYFEKRDTTLSTYIKSLHSLLWIICYYRDIHCDNGFNECNYDILQSILTYDLKAQLQSEPIEYDIYNDTEFEQLQRIKEVLRQHRHKYEYIYEDVFTTYDWNFADLSRIVYYIDKYDLDVFTVLNRLSADYSWAMSLPVKQPGIQSVSIMILGDLGYSFDMRMDRTPEVQAMIDEIYSIPTGFSLKDFNRSLDVLLRLYKRTVEKHLVWNSRLF